MENGKWKKKKIPNRIRNKHGHCCNTHTNTNDENEKFNSCMNDLL